MVNIPCSVLDREPSSIHLDLKSDLNIIVHKFLQHRGFPTDTLAKCADDLLLLYFKDLQLAISQKPRKVLYSSQFKCPPNYELALNEFVQKVEQGQDLSGFMSKRVKNNLNYNDSLLNDWGIYHFHLTRRFNSDGSAKRSNYQLFACCDDSTMYFIQIYPHHKDNLYSQKELLAIIKNNWSYLLCPLNELSMCEEITDAERENLRRNHCLTLTELDGKVYFPRGGGYASDGSSIWAVRHRDYYINLLGLTEWFFLYKGVKLINYVQSQTHIKINRNWQLKLINISANFLELRELSNLLVVRFYFNSYDISNIEINFLHPILKCNSITW